jgi:hypothetical protein
MEGEAEKEGKDVLKAHLKHIYCIHAKLVPVLISIFVYAESM